jgi:two-component system sensor histidine kinase QseC
MLFVFALGAADVVVNLVNLNENLRSHIMNRQVDTILASVGIDGADLTPLPTRFSETDWRYSLYDANRHLLASSPPAVEPLAFLSLDNTRIGGRSAQIARQIAGGRILVISKDDTLEREELRELIGQELTGSAMLMLFLVGISLLAMVALATWLLRSVRRAAALAATIGANNPQLRIPLDRLPLEILPLAEAANKALDKLADAYSAERRFTADAAHELRTPLAVLSLRLQKAKRDDVIDWESLDREMNQMKRLIDQLMALARADSGAPPQQRTATVSISRVTRLVVADMMLMFERAGRRINADIEDDLKTHGDEGQLRQAVQNLLDNGLKHGRGDVSVVLKSTGGDTVSLDIFDEGPAPTSIERDEWFLRFHKGRQGETGSGLGLSIVRQIVRNMGGDANFIEGPNFRLRLTLPKEGRLPAPA